MEVKNIDTDYEIDFKEAGVDIENPKNELQYQLYKCTLALEQIVGKLLPWLLKTADGIIKTFKPLIHYPSNDIRLNYMICSKEFETASALYPRVSYLARHAKKKRVRKKNITRLYKIGSEILKKES